MTRYLALLRGINVGGKNLIRMQDLKRCFELRGFADVQTFIQSGNVLFSSGRATSAELARRIEEALSARFGYQANIVLRSREQLAAVVAGAPEGFGAQPAKHRYDVIFLKAPLTAAGALKLVPLHPEVDRACGGVSVLYFSRLISKAAQSRLSRLVSLPIYKSMTIRNWNTTTRLLHLMQQNRAST